LSFISFLLSQRDFNEHKIKSIIDKMWDELIVNSFTDYEGDLFRKWFSDFTETVSVHLENNNILEDFFKEKIDILYKKSGQTSNYGLLRIFCDLFVKVNKVKSNIKEVSCTTEIVKKGGWNNDEKFQEKFLMITPGVRSDA